MSEKRAGQNANLDQLTTAALSDSTSFRECIELGEVSAVSSLLQDHTQTPEELKAGVLKAKEKGSHAIVGLLIGSGALPLENIALKPELKQVQIKE